MDNTNQLKRRNRIAIAVWILWPLVALGLLILVLFADIIFSPRLANASVDFAFAVPAGVAGFASSAPLLLVLLAWLFGPPLLVARITRKQLPGSTSTSTRES